ncbi:hypothetical protein [Vibrio sp. D431a]|uniref:hypothetical protein n=1 Tax=Vibrio sp. D431a TaxID=2837388 RepID=UPI002552B3B1|nr:hypothetical protein [Vibrio sp. D431a]MDK9789879.1 hypothetical protein [Vibrio sp. D431a]
MYCPEIEITDNPADFVPSMKIDDWIKKILETKPEVIRITTHCQLISLLRLHRGTKEIKYSKCKHLGKSVEVSHCGFIHQDKSYKIGHYYEETLKEALFLVQKSMPEVVALINIVISNSTEHFIKESELADWVDGIVRNCLSKGGEQTIYITEPEQLEILRALYRRNGVAIKTISLGDEKSEFKISSENYQYIEHVTPNISLFMERHMKILLDC